MHQGGPVGRASLPPVLSGSNSQRGLLLHLLRCELFVLGVVLEVQLCQLARVLLLEVGGSVGGEGAGGLRGLGGEEAVELGGWGRKA